MSKGPWTRQTKQLHEAERALKEKKIMRKIQSKREGFMSRAHAAEELHKEATTIADGPSREWVRYTLKLETREID
jgi:hypothetical protein